MLRHEYNSRFLSGCHHLFTAVDLTLTPDPTLVPIPSEHQLASAASVTSKSYKNQPNKMHTYPSSQHLPSKLTNTVCKVPHSTTALCGSMRAPRLEARHQPEPLLRSGPSRQGCQQYGGKLPIEVIMDPGDNDHAVILITYRDPKWACTD